MWWELKNKVGEKKALKSSRREQETMKGGKEGSNVLSPTQTQQSRVKKNLQQSKTRGKR